MRRLLSDLQQFNLTYFNLHSLLLCFAVYLADTVNKNMASFYVLEHIPLPRDKAFSVSPQNNTACAFSGLQFLLKHECFFIVLSESSEEPYLKKKNNNFLRLGRYIIIIFSQMFWIFCFCFFFFYTAWIW